MKTVLILLFIAENLSLSLRPVYPLSMFELVLGNNTAALSFSLSRFLNLSVSVPEEDICPAEL